jgi:ACS family glucarate transporter-like MFS transporter
MSKTFALSRPTHVRHLVVFVTMLTSVLLYLDRFCIAPAERLITRHLQMSDSQMGWVMGSFFAAYALGQVPSGWLSDRFGARRMLACYVLLWSLFTALSGLALGFWTLLAARAACGVAQAGAYPTAGGLLSRWVPFSNRGNASALIAFGGRIGGALAQYLTPLLIVLFAGLLLLPGGEAAAWRPVMLLYGGIGLAVAAVFWLCFRDWPAEHPWCNEDERRLIEAGRPMGQVSGKGRVGAVPLRQLLTSRSIWLLCIAQWGTNVGWLFLVTWLNRYLLEMHCVPLQRAGLMGALVLTVGWFGMLAGGRLSDALTRRLGLRWGRALPLALSRFMAMAAYLVCLAPLSPWLATAAFAVVAFSTDLGSPSVWAFNQDVGGRYVGSILGWGNMWGNLGAAVSPPLVNAVVEGYGWDMAFLTCAAAFGIAGVASLGVDATVPVGPKEEAAPEG